MSIIYFPIQGGSNLLYEQAVEYPGAFNGMEISAALDLGETASGMDLTGMPEQNTSPAGMEIAQALRDSAALGMEVGDLALTESPGGLELESGEVITILLEAIDDNLAAGRGDC
jgi:hypothetical protein